MTCLLGGTGAPFGATVAFIEAPHTAVLEKITSLRTRSGISPEVRIDLLGYPDCLKDLAPSTTPATKELLVVHGITWTAYLSNNPGGTDLWATCSAVATDLGTAGVMATHEPPDRQGDALTSLRLIYRDAGAGRMTERLVEARARRGRWSWQDSGIPMPFEQPEAYRARNVRDRLTRDLLVAYLQGMNILVDDDSFYGMATLVHSPEPVTTSQGRTGSRRSRH